MPTSSTSRDPRSLVTPDAFQVAPDLLGLPLATPRRRLAAVLLDLVFIGIVTVVTRSFALVLGVVVAAALVRAGFTRTPTRGNVFERARRASIGCLGLFVGLLTAGLWVVLTSDSVSVEVDEASGLVLNVGSSTFNLEDAAGATDPIEERDAQAVRDGVTLYTLDEVLERYATLRRAGSDDAMDQVLVQALEERLMSEVASDTLLALEAHIEDLEDEVADAEQRRGEAEEELDDALSGGFLNWLLGVADDLGFGFGWAALYMTVWMSVTNGQTLGKRVLGLRVVRLDGLPINWWVAFERAGGYAAGFATGLLGFAQIFWDANRQAIHDRIVGTVVVRDGLKRIPDWESAL